MTFIIGASAHGSPGVSTALQVMAAQWPNPDAVPVVVEADAGGGVVAARFDITITPGMVTLAESLRKFESPPLLDGAPDYTVEQFKARQPEFEKLRVRLDAFEIDDWPIAEQVD